MTYYATQPRQETRLEIKGDGTKYGIGMIIKMPTPKDLYQLDELIITRCCDPLQIRQGIVKIKDFVPYKTWGDSIKFHENSELYIENFHLDTPLHKLKYSKRYHVDRILQAYSLCKGANVGNVTIKNIIMHTTAPKDQGICLSEGVDRYHDFNIGVNGSIDISMQHQEWFKACNLLRGNIGLCSNEIKITGSEDEPMPYIRIGSKASPIKETPYTSASIQIAPDLQTARNVLPVHTNSLLIQKAEKLGITVNMLKELLQ